MTNRRKAQTDAEHLELARKIRAAGVPIYIQEDDSAHSDPVGDLLVWQVGGVIESSVFDFHGDTGVTLHVAMTVNRSGFAIDSFGLDLPWSKDVSWLGDPLERDGVSEVYSFGDGNALELERDDVLNHRANTGRMLSRGESLDGSLLGIANDSIPDTIQQNEMVPALLVIRDQFGRSYPFPVKFWADRSGRQRGRAASRRTLIPKHIGTLGGK